jgi:DNA replication protein DnaD
MLDEFGPEWVFEAVKVAALQRARTIGYVSAVLDKWSKSGKKAPWIDDKPKEPVKEKPAGPTREQLESFYKEKLYGQKS